MVDLIVLLAEVTGILILVLAIGCLAALFFTLVLFLFDMIRGKA